MDQGENVRSRLLRAYISIRYFVFERNHKSSFKILGQKSRHSKQKKLAKKWLACSLKIDEKSHFPSTLFENYLKCHIWIFDVLTFSTNFCPLKTDLTGNTVWPQASGFQKLAKWDHFGNFNELLSKQNVNVARNVEWDFFCDFQTPWVIWEYKMSFDQENKAL